MTTTIEKTTFSTPTLSEGGRRIASKMTLEQTRDAQGGVVELEVSTNHWAGRGYQVSLTRAWVKGISRSINISFGEHTDNLSLNIDQHRPASTRFNRGNAERLHRAVVQEIEQNIDQWIAWGEQKSHRD